MSHENYVSEASRALYFVLINFSASVVFGALAAVCVFYGTAGWAIGMAVMATICMFGVAVNLSDFRINQRRADATRPTHRL